MSIHEETGSLYSELSDSQVQRLMLYFCSESLRLKRVSVRKSFGKTFMQKGIAKMVEEGIPLLKNYFFTLDRVACKFSPGLQSDYNKLQDASYVGNLQAFKQVGEILKNIYGTDLLNKIEQVADSMKEGEVKDLISQSDKKDEEEVRRSKLFYLNPEATNILSLKKSDLEAETKEMWINNLGKNASLPTANPVSVRSGKLLGLVKTTGFFIPIDYLIDPNGKLGKIVALFGDSRQDLNQSCICLLDQEVTIQAFAQYEDMLPEGKFLVIGKVVPNPYRPEGSIQENSEMTEAPFALNALAILQVVVGCHTVITSVDRCVDEIKLYAKRDSYEAFQKSLDITNRGARKKKCEPKTVLKKILDFCKFTNRDGETYPKEIVQPPHETLTIGQGDCKAKVCLAYSMLLHENFVEKLDLVFLDTEGMGKPNHVQLEAKIHGVSSPITLELTGNASAFRREIDRFALPLYAN